MKTNWHLIITRDAEVYLVTDPERDTFGEVVHTGPDSMAWAFRFVRQRIEGTNHSLAVNGIPEQQHECVLEVDRAQRDNDYSIKVGPYRW